jgi:hypothetical protein
LVNFWPLDDGIANDFAGQMNLHSPSDNNVGYVNDRFGYSTSALALNQGAIQAPKGVYFNGPFTVTVWVYLNKYTNNARILDFGKGPDDRNVIIMVNSVSVYFAIKYPGANRDCSTNAGIPLNVWTHLTVQYDGSRAAYIYIGGILKSSCLDKMWSESHLNVETSSNFIGKSNTAGDDLLDGAIDELKIYSRVLNEAEIKSDIFSYFKFGPANSVSDPCYFGCYADLSTSEFSNTFPNSPDNIGTCVKTCTDRNFLYAALNK